MKRKFKVGDKFVCVDDFCSHFVKKGEIYNIKSVKCGRFTLEEAGEYPFDPSRFKLVKSKRVTDNRDSLVVRYNSRCGLYHISWISRNSTEICYSLGQGYDFKSQALKVAKSLSEKHNFKLKDLT